MIVRILALAVLLALFVPAAARAQVASTDSALAVFEGGAVYPTEFIRAWWNLSPDRRPPGDALKSRQVFLSQIVDRKLLAREAAKHTYELTPTEQGSLDRTRDQLVQNALFDHMSRTILPPTDAQLEQHKRRLSTLAEVGFVTFANFERARLWRQRLATGTPFSALTAAIAREGTALASVDSFRFVAAEQIPDTLANLIWAMRVGQVSEVQSFGGQPLIIMLRRYQDRMSNVPVNDASALRNNYMRRQFDLMRERFRNEIATQVRRRFDEEGMKILLKAHLLVPPRSDVDTLTGIPVMRPNMPLPPVAFADTGHAVAYVGNRAITIGEYLTYWGRVPPVTRPEVRERPSLEGAVDRVALAPEIIRISHERGYDKDPRMLLELAAQREGYQLDHWHEAEIASKVKVTDTALRRFWEKDKDHYNDRASITSRFILVDRKSLADSLLTRLKGGANFAELAREYSNDAETGARGGEAGTQFRGTQPNAGLEDAMFATPVGQVAGPEKVPQGWVIWRIDDAKPGVVRNFEEAREMVERDYRILEADRMVTELLEKLRKEAGVKIYEERMTADLGKGGPWED